jgi:hypothetical protein
MKLSISICALLFVGLASCQPEPAPEPPAGPTLSSDDARDLARAYTAIAENKLVIAEMRLKQLHEDTSSDVARSLAEIGIAEVEFRRRSLAKAREIASRHQQSTYREVAADAHFLIGKIELDAWNLQAAHRAFETYRRISRDAGLGLREGRATEYLRFTEALIMLDSGRYREAKEVFRSITAPELQSAIAKLEQ